MLFRRRLPPAVAVSLRRTARGRVLGWAEGVGGYAVALAQGLALGRPEDWCFIPWYDIVAGAWDPATGRLSWRTGPGESGSVTLERPAAIPGLFQERVNATFVTRERIALGAAAVVVSAQRRDGRDLIWRITPVAGTTVTPELMVLAEQRLTELKAAVD